MATKKKKLIMEQNKILIIICVGFIIGIGILGLFFYLPSFTHSNKNTNTIINDDGIVDDLGRIRGNK